LGTVVFSFLQAASCLHSIEDASPYGDIFQSRPDREQYGLSPRCLRCIVCDPSKQDMALVPVEIDITPYCMGRKPGRRHDHLPPPAADRQRWPSQMLRVQGLPITDGAVVFQREGMTGMEGAPAPAWKGAC